MVETRIGVCPICRKTAELILSGKPDEKVEVVCENEYYIHTVGNVDYIKKKRPPKYSFN